MKAAQQIAPSPDQSTSANDPMLVMIHTLASNPEVDVEKLGKVLDMQERILNRNAQDAYAEAMTACQDELPPVNADSYNTQTHSPYASYEAINEVAKPIYTKHGFSISFGSGGDESTPLQEGMLRVAITIRHKLGHTERDFIDLPLDDAGIQGSRNKTAVHATASTRKYGRRYLLSEALNITVVGLDKDGNMPQPKRKAAPQKQLTTKQVGALQKMAKYHKVDMKAAGFCNWANKKFGTCELGKFPSTAFDAVKAILEKNSKNQEFLNKEPVQ